MHLSHHHRPTVRTTERSRREGGYVMAMFGLLLVPLLLMAGLAVDVGSWYNRASDIQKAADAASLAGVVWLPDVAKAREVALEVAEKNGFDNGDPNITVTVNPSTRSPRRLHVTITDNRVGSFFYSNVGGDDINIARGSFAEFVTPVPMGSPRNFFGTGQLLAEHSSTPTAFESEELYMATNPFCADREWGDRHQSRYITTTSCTSGTTNPDWQVNGYELYVEAKANRPSPIELRLWDPRYNWTSLTTTIPLPPTCPTSAYVWNGTFFGPESSSTSVTITGPMQYQTRNNSTTNTYAPVVELLAGQTFTRARNLIRYRSPDHSYAPVTAATTWTGPSGSSTNVSIVGPLQYQIRNNTGSAWQTAINLPTGSSLTRAGNLLRYRSPTYTPSVCTPNSTTEVEPQIDNQRRAQAENFTFSLYAADTTPLDDSDNPLMCRETFGQNAAFDGYSYLGSRRWNTLQVSNTNTARCAITTSMPDGKYILRITNNGAVGNNADGSNQWGIVAKYDTAAGDGLCDGRNDNLCPRVYGKEAISVRAAATTTQASFYLAEIAPEHAGKKLKLELFDPGEGGQRIEIRRPTGANTWVAVPFTWTSGTLSGSGSSLDVTGNRFNGRLVDITVDLTGYSPPANNNWWKIFYSFSGAVTDRTTWSARIVGDPVHLLEEN